MSKPKSQTNKPAETKQEEMVRKFRAKWEELQDWGLSEGIYIDAFLDTSVNGIRPYVAFRPLSPTELAEFREMTSKQAKTDLAIAKEEPKEV